MSSIIVFILVVIIWAVFGSLSAAGKKKPERQPVRPAKPQRAPEPKGETRQSRVQDPTHKRVKQKRSEDRLADLGDFEPFDQASPPMRSIKVSPLGQEPKTSSSAVQLDAKKLQEAVILAEYLGPPRAKNPHPLVKNYMKR
ncbi:hypothetical protein ACFO4N_04745 [Camelliibacillus cellulosilyticus]|uniref:Uncharacterized protein n=1 Tax=Camelliibacillus cellulosilyticus TaxID=2174486 RepID=A0ABV9GMZ9_9BACL